MTEEGDRMQTKFVPVKDELYISVGEAGDVEQVLKSGMFYPTMVTGPTGIGKTKSIEQICNKLQLSLYRVNITIESDEDSLMGGFRLIDGNTFFDKGPVLKAMEEGAILLLDEIDLGMPTKLLCLQSVLEGVGYLIKKTGEFVRPKPGFTVIATANTKGNGDEKGIYVGTQILNGAMLDRFPVVFSFTYPTKKEEEKILYALAGSLDLKIEKKEVDLLLEWADHTRSDSKRVMHLDFAISTRRLCDIIKAMKIFKSLDSAVEKCINQFDEAHQQSFKQFYDLLKDQINSGKTPEKDQEDDMVYF